jgi:hypothetical protein
MVVGCHNPIMVLIILHQFSSTTMAIAPLHYIEGPRLSLLLWCECMLLLVLSHDFFVIVSLSLDLQATSQLEVVLQLA